jgi:hypothetical protein
MPRGLLQSLEVLQNASWKRPFIPESYRERRLQRTVCKEPSLPVCCSLIPSCDSHHSLFRILHKWATDTKQLCSSGSWSYIPLSHWGGQRLWKDSISVSRTNCVPKKTANPRYLCLRITSDTEHMLGEACTCLHFLGLSCLLVSFLLFFFFFFCSTGAWTQGLHLEPLHQPYACKGFFMIGFLELFCLGWLWTMILLISASWVARITGVSHQLQALELTLNSFGSIRQFSHLKSLCRAEDVNTDSKQGKWVMIKQTGITCQEDSLGRGRIRCSLRLLHLAGGRCQTSVGIVAYPQPKKSTPGKLLQEPVNVLPLLHSPQLPPHVFSWLPRTLSQLFLESGMRSTPPLYTSSDHLKYICSRDRIPKEVHFN